ncbi:hypothetical protein LINGRAHAP2_LOCUS13691 [Linum grandiflorum]
MYSIVLKIQIAPTFFVWGKNQRGA